jgi:hypothetical protein
MAIKESGYQDTDYTGGAFSHLFGDAGGDADHENWHTDTDDTDGWLYEELSDATAHGSGGEIDNISDTDSRSSDSTELISNVLLSEFGKEMNRKKAGYSRKTRARSRICRV